MPRAFFTTSILTAILLTACSEAPQSNTEANAETSQTVTKPDSQEILAVKNQTPASLKHNSHGAQRSDPYKHYEGLDSKYITQAEIDELIALQEEKRQFSQTYRKELQAWINKDPSTRGTQPQWSPSPSEQVVMNRIQILNNKVQSANRAKHQIDTLEHRSKTHNISLSDSEKAELSSLQLESQKLQSEMQKIMQEAQKSNQVNGTDFSQASVFNTLPKDVIQRMFQVQKRIEEINFPIAAAEKADRIRKQMNALSTQSGVPILSSEIEEAIALNAEKDKIKKKTQIEAYNKWVIEGGPINIQQSPTSEKDHARLKEIDARIKAISAPMHEAQNAAREANNPVLKQHRLAREKQQRWREEWQDRKRSGEIPVNAIMHSPSYAEIQDRVTDYRAKLKTRADKVGYNVPEADLKRLEALNAQMVAIRKTVDAMEMDGTAMIDVGNGRHSPAFGLTSGMHKVRLIEQKQHAILAGLSEAEKLPSTSSQNSNSEIGTKQFNGGYNSSYNNFQTRISADALIESFRTRGIEVSQSEADELRAFERAMAEK